MKQFLYAALIEVVFEVPRLIIAIFTGTRFRKNRFILEGWKFEGFWSWKDHRWIRRDSRTLAISFLWISDKSNRSYASFILEGWSSSTVSSRSFMIVQGHSSSFLIILRHFLFVQLSLLFAYLSLLTGSCHFRAASSLKKVHDMSPNNELLLTLDISTSQEFY